MRSKNKSIRYRNRNKRRAVEYLGGKCITCGYSKSLAALDFHHRNENEKEWPPSRLMSYRWEVVKKEIEKCDLLCANCHRELHEGITEFELQRQPLTLNTKTCPICEMSFETKVKTQTYCSTECVSRSQEKIDWPNHEVLTKMVEDTNFSAVGRQLGVSDNAVRKRLKQHGAGW